MMPTTMATKSKRPAPLVLCAPIGSPRKRAVARSSVTVPGRPPATVPAACASPSRQRMPRHACPFAAPPSPPGGCPAPAPAQAGKGCAAGVHTGCAHRVLRRRAHLVATPPRRPLAGPAAALHLRQPKPARDAPQVCIPVLPVLPPRASCRRAASPPYSRPGGCPAPAPTQAGKGCATGVHTGLAAARILSPRRLAAL